MIKKQIALDHCLKATDDTPNPNRALARSGMHESFRQAILSLSLRPGTLSLCPQDGLSVFSHTSVFTNTFYKN